MNVNIVAITKGAGEIEGRSAEDVTTYITRVSNPSNQNAFETGSRLLGRCIGHSHWSPFEHASMTLEITTSRAIAAQILRHRSFKFQEHSQRYAKASNNIIYEARRQDVKDRQNSIDDISESDKQWWRDKQQEVWDVAYKAYCEALDRGFAKECARFPLPLSTETRLYMTGDIRSWIHYIKLRTDPSTQREHRIIANQCKAIFVNEFPDIALALGWRNPLKLDS